MYENKIETWSLQGNEYGKCKGQLKRLSKSDLPCSNPRAILPADVISSLISCQHGQRALQKGNLMLKSLHFIRNLLAKKTLGCLPQIPNHKSQVKPDFHEILDNTLPRENLGLCHGPKVGSAHGSQNTTKEG
jgi:hypothetical protein